MSVARGAQPDSRGGDGAEPLLPSRVPDLQLHFLPVDLHGPDLEIHADRGDVAACTDTHVSKAHGSPGQTALPSLWARHGQGPRDMMMNEEDMVLL